jgi:hypothetical protein
VSIVAGAKSGRIRGEWEAGDMVIY